ncbi:MAG: hypothetical protein J3Q66DRAFT_400609 [Benniella sp.]|nr:MAG: hypothetical protein J3Q66DRAFT_400609 [Benniella sp.]
MRVAAYFITTTSVALCASALAFPTLYRRVAQGTKCDPDIYLRNQLVGEGDCSIWKSIQFAIMGKYNTSLSPTTVINGTLTSAIPDTLIKVAPGQKEGFTAFMKSLITNLRTHSPSVELSMESPTRTQVSITFEPTTGTTTFTSLVNLINSSQLVLIFGDVIYRILDKNGVVVGSSVFKNARLKIGDYPITMVTTMASKEVYDALLTEGYTLTHQGFEGSSANPILVGTFMTVKFDMEGGHRDTSGSNKRF